MCFCLYHMLACLFVSVRLAWIWEWVRVCVVWMCSLFLGGWHRGVGMGVCICQQMYMCMCPFSPPLSQASPSLVAYIHLEFPFIFESLVTSRAPNLVNTQNFWTIYKHQPFDRPCFFMSTAPVLLTNICLWWTS